MTIHFCIFFCFRSGIAPCSPACPHTYCVDAAGLALTAMLLPLLLVAGIKGMMGSGSWRCFHEYEKSCACRSVYLCGNPFRNVRPRRRSLYPGMTFSLSFNRHRSLVRCQAFQSLDGRERCQFCHLFIEKSQPGQEAACQCLCIKLIWVTGTRVLSCRWSTRVCAELECVPFIYSLRETDLVVHMLIYFR